jgi:hypothetical protein
MHCLFQHATRKNGFLTGKYSKKLPILNTPKRPLHHFGQVDFDMSTMSGVVFFIGKVWTI